MKNLTDLITQDADTKCRREVNDFCERLKKEPLFKPLHDLKVTLPDGSVETLGSALYNVNYPLGMLIHDYFLPAFIADESQQFYNKVKQMPEL